MSGLAGAVSLLRRPDVDAVGRMLDALQGRRWGPRRIWGDGHAVLGFRYSTVPEGATLQPVVDVDAGLAVVVDGRLANRGALRQDLALPTDDDAHLVLAAYRRWGEGFVDHLDGEFALMLVDHARRTVLLARDALGVKPLYMAETADGVLVASTLPALLAGGGVDTSIDEEALQHYLGHSSVAPAPRTILRGVRKLPPATLRVLTADGARDRVYWRPAPPDEAVPDQGPQYRWRDDVHDSLLSAVRRRLPRSGQVSVLLSGGVDSSLLVALLSDCHRGEITTFSIGFDSVDGVQGDEFEYSRVVARRFGTTHHCLHVPTSDLVPAVTQAVEDMPEPMAGHDAPGFHLLARHVSEHTDSVMCGHGAQEVLASGHRPEHTAAELETVGDTLTMTGAWGVEATAPFLDRDLVRLAARHRLHEPGGPSVLELLGRHLLPDGVTHRPKRHLLLPALMHLDGPVLALVRDTFSSAGARSRALLQPQALETLLEAQRGGALPAGVNALWQLAVLEMWLQHHGV